MSVCRVWVPKLRSRGTLPTSRSKRTHLLPTSTRRRLDLRHQSAAQSRQMKASRMLARRSHFKWTRRRTRTTMIIGQKRATLSLPASPDTAQRQEEVEDQESLHLANTCLTRKTNLQPNRKTSTHNSMVPKTQATATLKPLNKATNKTQRPRGTNRAPQTPTR